MKSQYREVQHWPLSSFIHYQNNPRRHEVARIEQFAKAIKKFGFRVPVLARSNGEVIDGHLRLKAAERLSLETVPVLLCDDMTPEQIRAFRVSVNRMSELAEWDEDALLRELECVQAEGGELGEDGPIGFDLEDMNAPLDVEAWDFSPVKDLFVVTITGSLPIEAEVRARLKGMEGVTIEASSIQQA